MRPYESNAHLKYMCNPLKSEMCGWAKFQAIRSIYQDHLNHSRSIADLEHYWISNRLRRAEPRTPYALFVHLLDQYSGFQFLPLTLR